MLQALVGLERGLAGTATLLIRFCTLWFAVSLGLAVLLVFRRRLFPAQDANARPHSERRPAVSASGQRFQ